MSEVTCDYCGKAAELVGGDVIYPHRSDLASKKFYLCEPCEAYVGCHPGTTNTLGRLANKELRAAKSAAHAVFDPLWKAKIRREQCKKGHARRAAYAWLSEQLGIHPDDCHIGMFDIETCQRVVDLCSQYRVRA